MSKKNKSQQTKIQYLKDLSKNLQFFYPELNEIFMCPICLNKIPLQRKSQISEAHIIPKAAGGKLKTYLCKDCNNKFGSQQDKWFGEYIRLNEKNQNILQSHIKYNNFKLDNIKIDGQWNFSKDKGIEVLIHRNRNSPELIKNILEKYKNESPKSLKINIPILAQERMIKIGFLTAAYLMWFATFGYSWVLQSHLDKIREQIHSPDKEIISDNFWAKGDCIKDKLWIGILKFENKIALVTGISGFLVIFQPIDDQNIYSDLQQIKLTKPNMNINHVEYYPMYFKNKKFYNTPVSLIFDNRFLFLPDICFESKMEFMTIYFSSHEHKAKFLFPVKEDKYNILSKKSDIKIIKIKRFSNDNRISYQSNSDSSFSYPD